MKVYVCSIHTSKRRDAMVACYMVSEIRDSLLSSTRVFIFAHCFHKKTGFFLREKTIV